MPTKRRSLLAILSMGITLAGAAYFLDVPNTWKVWILAVAVGGNGLLTFFDEDTSESVTFSEPDPISATKGEELLSLWMRKRLGRRASTAYRGTILLWDPASRELYVWATVWDGKFAPGERDLRFRADQGCVGKAFTEGLPVLTDLVLHGHESWKVPRDSVWAEMKSILCVPLKWQGRVVGVVSIDSNLSLKRSHLSRKSTYSNLNEYSNRAISPYLSR